jgi:hypothetical protein
MIDIFQANAMEVGEIFGVVCKWVTSFIEDDKIVTSQMFFPKHLLSCFGSMNWFKDAFQNHSWKIYFEQIVMLKI